MLRMSLATKNKLYKRRGDAYFCSGDYDKARADYESALKTRVDNDEEPVLTRDIRLKLALILSRSNKLEQALRDLNTLVGQFPDYAPLYVEIGTIVTQSGDLDKAIEYVSKAISLDGQLVEAHYVRAQLFFRQAKYDKCVRDVNKVLELMPFFPTRPERPYLLKAKGLLRLGRYEQAIANIHMARRMAPESPEVMFALWSVYQAAQKFNVSNEVANQLSKLAPDTYEAWLALAASNNALHRWSEARSAAEKGLAIKRQDATLLNELGIAFDGLQNFDRALHCFDDVLAGDSDHVYALAGKAFIMSTCAEDKCRNGRTALELAMKAVELAHKKGANEEGMLLVVLACAYAECGDYDNAQDAIRKSLKCKSVQLKGGDRREKMQELFKTGKPYRRQYEALQDDDG
jgi:tetratricopeptide (TPR) repeat protein